jgi:FkbM family methyltransferase
MLPPPAGRRAGAPAPSEAELLAALVKRMDALCEATRLLSLGPDRIFTFADADVLVRMYLPFADRDVIQRRVFGTAGFYEAKQLADIRPLVRPGAVVVDAGANIGNHSLYFALVCGAAVIHAFAPMRVTAGILKRNLALNGLEDRVIVHEVALGAASGTARLLRYPGQNIGAAAVDATEPGGYRVEPLDSFRLDRVDFLKMDVEGGFVAALEGAADTLARCRPPVWLELRPKLNEVEPGTAALAKLGYRYARRIAGSENDHLFLPG